ncbi:GNAT family N-acetyltransferase [Asanoa sp. NPDC049573]|uniref:GNAT family N-acetyltransferase n=1 Tax=Asanoa sp. NPDC049573 TaxID=3155396 RepID=UPI003448C597
MTFDIREETGDDTGAVHAIHAAAFGGDRVPRLVTRLRQHRAALPPRGFVATVDDEPVGHVLLTASWLDAPRELVDVLVLSPLGVLPQHQRRGIGTLLVARRSKKPTRPALPCCSWRATPVTTGSAASTRRRHSVSASRACASPTPLSR